MFVIIRKQRLKLLEETVNESCEMLLRKDVQLDLMKDALNSANDEINALRNLVALKNKELQETKNE